MGRVVTGVPGVPWRLERGHPAPSLARRGSFQERVRSPMKFLLDTDSVSFALRCVLVSNNTRQFAKVPGLQLEDWT